MENLKIISAFLAIINSFAILFTLFYHFGVARQKIKRNEEDIKNNTCIINKIKDSIAKMRAEMKGSFGEFKIFMQMSMSGNIAKSQSPLMLTDLGQEIAKDINATAIIDKNWDVIFKK